MGRDQGRAGAGGPARRRREERSAAAGRSGTLIGVQPGEPDGFDLHPLDPDRNTAGEDQAASARLERLRGYRVPARRGLGIASMVEHVRVGVRKRSRAEAEVVRAFEAVCPAALRERVIVERVTRRVVTVKCDDAGVRFRLDRWLRGGGEAQVRSEAKAAVTRVKAV